MIVRNISQRKKQQQQLEESENRFRALYDNASFALGMAKGVKGVHELVNQAWVDLFGYSDVSEVLGIPIMDFVAPEDRAKVAKYAQLRNEGKVAPPVYEIEEAFEKTGLTFDMEMRVSTYTYEGELHSIAMITDISDRKAAQEDRDRIFNLSSDLITVLGFDGFFKQLNPAWEEVMGYETHELIGTSFSYHLFTLTTGIRRSEEVKKLSEASPYHSV